MLTILRTQVDYINIAPWLMNGKDFIIKFCHSLNKCNLSHFLFYLNTADVHLLLYMSLNTSTVV